MINMTDGQLKTCEPLGEDDLCDIYTLAIKTEWTSKIVQSNADPYDLSVTELIDYLVKLELVDKMRIQTKALNPMKVNTNQLIRFEVITMMNNMTMDDNEEIDDPKEVRACPTCGKHHRGRCWHKNKNDKQGKKFCPGSAGKPTQEKTYTMEEINELIYLSFAMFGKMDASNKKGSNKKCKTGNNEQELQLNHMLANMCSYYHNNNNNTSHSEDEE
jgi:hypothetical protein